MTPPTMLPRFDVFSGSPSTVDDALVEVKIDVSVNVSVKDCETVTRLSPPPVGEDAEEAAGGGECDELLPGSAAAVVLLVEPAVVPVVSDEGCECSDW